MQPHALVEVAVAVAQITRHPTSSRTRARRTSTEPSSLPDGEFLIHPRHNPFIKPLGLHICRTKEHLPGLVILTVWDIDEY